MRRGRCDARPGAALAAGLLGAALLLAGLGPAARAQAAEAVQAPSAPASAAPAASAPTAGEVSTPGEITWTLGIEAPEALRPLLERHLDLSRFQRAGRQERITRGELLRLLAAAPAQTRALLETEGYFSSTVRALLPEGQAGGPADGSAVQVRLRVDPGPRTQVGEVALEIGGALAEAAAQGDAAARALTAQLRAGWSLPQGQPFTREAWDDAKTALLTLLRTQGYPAAGWSHSAARVQPARQVADLQLHLDSGPLFRFGAFHFEGLRQVRLDAVLALRNVRAGDPLLEQALLNYQDRLVRTGLFDTVAVTYDPDPQQAAATPIQVRVRERMLQQATVGVGVSDLSGPRVTLEHLHQRPFDFGWQAKTRLQLGRDARALSLDFISHPHPGPYRNLLAGEVGETDAGGLRVTSERLRLGRTQDTERIERTYYVELQRAFTRDLASQAITDDASAASFNYQWVWRRLDHPVLPTQGWGISADGAVGRSFASRERSGWFGRANARVTAYWTPGEHWYGQSRIELGQVLAHADVAVPYPLLFRAGGDDSVRGYSYQGLGPTDADGSAIGGRVLATGSLELARPFSLRHPAWWGAVFVDAGHAAVDWSEWRAAWGYGAGVRWRSPVGALRIDLAWGEQRRRLRLHFTVGLTF
ncbi:MAG: BamA/TamA family outer membrane protein [Burkholderiaceae bacterium]|nr:BamA/TamA family outer membrane protein [Burkholderiaceae bacterium]